MKNTFKLPDFPDSLFEIETSIWTGKSILKKDGILVEQSKDKGKPFLIPLSNREILRAYPKQSLPDLIPTLLINGKKFETAKKLEWYKFVIGSLPILLLFLGGMIGGLIGLLGTVSNYHVFRQEGTELSKYIKVIGIIAGSYFLYILFYLLIHQLLGR